MIKVLHLAFFVALAFGAGIRATVQAFLPIKEQQPKFLSVIPPQQKASSTLPLLGSPNTPKLPFPQWLTDFTGLKEWPGMEPPYIPLDFIDFNKIRTDVPVHAQGVCDPSLRTSGCSFDCFNCVAPDDVYTCPALSQTFDDGPSPATTKLLDNLSGSTTFFTLGVNVVRYPEIYLDTLKRGHVMGSHTWSHKFLPSLTNEQVIAQIEWSVWAMNATAGHLPKWFRPPFGGIDERVRSIVRQFGLQSVLWDFDTNDWRMLNGDNTRKEADIYADLRRFKSTHGLKGLILEHDGTMRTVDVGIEINKKILNDINQMTVPQCVGGIDYIKKFTIETSS